jgi:hypothetical protein
MVFRSLQKSSSVDSLKRNEDSAGSEPSAKYRLALYTQTQLFPSRNSKLCNVYGLNGDFAPILLILAFHNARKVEFANHLDLGAD